MLTTNSGIVPAMTTAHYTDGLQADVTAEEADSVDLVTLGSNPTQLTNVAHIEIPNFSSRLTATPNRYFVGEAGDSGSGGSQVDPLRVPQYLTSTERVANTATFHSGVFSVAPGAYPWAPLDGLDNYSFVASDVTGSPAIVFTKPGIYQIDVHCNVTDNATGSYRAVEMIGQIGSGSSFDLTSMDSPQWKTDMGYLTLFVSALIIPPGISTDSTERDAKIQIDVNHDSDISLDHEVQTTITTLAFFETQ